MNHYQKYRESSIKASRRYQLNNPEKAKSAKLKSHYGITLDDYNIILSKQNNSCAICEGPPVGNGARNGYFQVDHNHDTGAVRGLLCSRCNMGLGVFKENPGLLKRAIEYLGESESN